MVTICRKYIIEKKKNRIIKAENTIYHHNRDDMQYMWVIGEISNKLKRDLDENLWFCSDEKNVLRYASRYISREIAALEYIAQRCIEKAESDAKYAKYLLDQEINLV